MCSNQNTMQSNATSQMQKKHKVLSQLSEAVFNKRSTKHVLNWSASCFVTAVDAFCASNSLLYNLVFDIATFLSYCFLKLM